MIRSSFFRPVVVLALGLALTLISPSSAFSQDKTAADLDHRFQNQVRPFLGTYCISCHGKDKPKAGVSLDGFTTTESVGRDFPRWEAILEQIQSGDMPPESAKKQPTKADRQATIQWIESFRQYEAKRTAGDPGPVLARRLSQAEFDFTIRDLTGVDIQPAKEFPVDPANGSGFDNTGESLAMSPALVTKYLAASRLIADHLVFQSEGFTFASFPALTDTDRDKFGVRCIVDFYKSQPTDLAEYFQAAWKYQHRAALGKPQLTLAECATSARVSPKYLETIWSTLTETKDDLGPIAALQNLWNHLPGPKEAKPDEIGRACIAMRNLASQWREKVKVKVRNLSVPGMNPGAQAIVLWKDREMAANRRNYGGGALKLKPEDWTTDPTLTRFFQVADTDKDRETFEATFKRFCSVFPDAFYISERGRVFLDPKEDRFNTGRLLSAGFHNQMGYFRDDQPLCEMILDEKKKKALDTLWQDFELASDVPVRMHSGLVWFERSESSYLAEKQFDFARAEDKDLTTESKFQKFAKVYLEKTRRVSKDPTVIQAVEDHFRISEANIRKIERIRKASESTHLKSLQDFAERAYRRHLSPQEREDILGFYRTLRKEDGISHEDAVRDTLVSILMSPQFCFRVDLPLQSINRAAAKNGAQTNNAPTGQTQPLSDEALASRLSYFLWSSMPDAELMDCATKGTLHQPEVLIAQSRRMIRDDRVRGLVTQFGGNWLDFRRFYEHNAVDRGRFPAFDNDLRQAMYEEPVRFLQDLIQKDRSVLDCLSAKHTFVNKPLAKHYGIPFPSRIDAKTEVKIDAKTDVWQRVENAEPYGRGGLLPMAIFLTRNAPGLRTSPVKRGYWVVTRLLGERIPAPPPNVPELPADEKNLGARTLRETLARHREEKSCATCHTRFDSFGLAFEGFGPVGEKRSVDLAGHPVDTIVGFPGGSEGDGVKGLRQYLLEKRSTDFLDNLCRKLLSYGLSRSLQLSDETTIATMRKRLGENENRFGAMIETIVLSPQFLNKRANAPTSSQPLAPAQRSD